MPLKFKAKSKDEIPAELHSLYVERDGAFVLDVDGAVDKTRVDEFRANNITLANQLADQKRRFEGIDPDEARQLAEKQALQAGEVEKVIDGRVRTVKSQLERHYSGIVAERDALNSQLTAVSIDQGVTNAASKKGLRATAIPDITSRARTVFKLVKGAPTAYEADGQTVRVGKDGLTPLTLEEWVDQQVADAPHLFESNVGGSSGAAGQPSGGGGYGRPTRSVKNPFRKETWNLTEQMKLQKNDPQLAARLRASA
jgi:hypothetical protein